MISLFSLRVSNAWQECRWECLAITVKKVPVFIFRCDIQSDLGVELPRSDYNSALCIRQHFNLCSLSLLARVNGAVIKINNRAALAALQKWLEHQTTGLWVWFPSPLQEYVFPETHKEYEAKPVKLKGLNFSWGVPGPGEMVCKVSLAKAWS